MKTTLFLLCLFLAGCASTAPVATSEWHEKRVAELKEAYAIGEISEEEYRKLVDDLDQRMDGTPQL